jgi:hypothetical protein
MVPFEMRLQLVKQYYTPVTTNARVSPRPNGAKADTFAYTVAEKLNHEDQVVVDCM